MKYQTCFLVFCFFNTCITYISFLFSAFVQMRERKRIKEAGGFITFNGVWRVAGILATSRALGDYPLKDKKLVIANPDILTFDLSNHRYVLLCWKSNEKNYVIWL